jgi:hypothetical protein
LRLLEGLSVNKNRGGDTLAGVVRRVPSARRVSRRVKLLAGAGMRLVAVSIAMLALLAGAPSAQASQASTIVEKCAKKESFGGYSQNAYRQALKQLPTIVVEYTACTEEIRKAELAAAGGGGEVASTTSPASVPLALTPTEQSAVQNAHHNGATPVRIGSEPIRPGVVHANIASAINTLPHSLFAVLALMFAGAVALTIGEVRKRVRSRRDS